MNLSLEILQALCALYALFLFLGWGAARLLLPHDALARFIYAPWLGIVLSGSVLTFAGLSGAGTDRSQWIALGASLGLMVYSYAAVRAQLAEGKKIALVFMGVIFFAFLILCPSLRKANALSSFTIGNYDLYDYIMTARHLQENGLHPYVDNLFGRQPEGINSSMRERIVSWQIPSPRWMSYYDLSLACSLFKRDPAQLFSTYLVLLFALGLPAIFLLARNLGLEGAGLAFASMMIAVNPHILYIASNGFLPQIAGTGLLICFTGTFLRLLEPGEISWKALLLSGILAGGVLGCYPELFTFILFIAGASLSWAGWTGKIAFAGAIQRLAFLLACVALLCPLQAIRFAPVIMLHAGDSGGGWIVSDRYYLFVYPLGGFFSHPHFPKPSPVLEWVLAPLVSFLIVRGFRQIQLKPYFFILLLPFILTGALAFAQGWNYKFYKNFTYIYFWLPIALGAGIQNLWPDLSVRPRSWPKWGLAAVSMLMVGSITAVAAAKSAESLGRTSINADRIPLDFRSLENLNRDSGSSRLFVSGLSDWQSLWVGYYLRDKNLLFPKPVIYMRNDLASYDDLKSLDLLARTDDPEAAEAAKFYEMGDFESFGPLALYRHRSRPI